jgi:hypothetical protein
MDASLFPHIEMWYGCSQWKQQPRRYVESELWVLAVVKRTNPHGYRVVGVLKRVTETENCILYEIK